ncbi:MAG: hypothetical protein H0X42_11510 [Solirubrobacterales bacterium]|nr:hypothetical protein [Solirubrobacterales bacterium]
MRKRESGNFSLSVCALALLGIASLLVLFASSASALETRVYSGASLGPEGTTGSARFNILQAVTADQSSGDIYVLDTGEGGKLYKFNAGGEPINFTALGGNVIEEVGGSEGGAENEIAIAPPGSPGGTAGDIYVANNSIVKIYAPSGAELGTLGEGETCGVAVDPAGHLFVGSFGSTIREYVPSANPAKDSDLTETGTAEIGLCNVAADGLGNIYASNFFGSSTAKLEGLADAEPTLIEPGGPTLAIDPTTNDLYLDRGSSVAVYSSAGEPKGQFGAAGLSGSHGVAIGATAEKAYVNNGASGKVDIYGATVVLPDVTTEPATEIGKESAVLNGTISAAGGPEATCEFEYVATTKAGLEKNGFADASTAPCAPAGPFSGSGTNAVSAEVTELEIGTTYFFRLVGTNENGSNPDPTSQAGALSFRTAGPSIVSSSATKVTSTAVTIFATINPNAEPATYRVEYGPTESYGSIQPIPDANVVLPVGKGNFEEGQTLIENIAVAQGTFVVGQEIVGEGIEAGTTITKIESKLVIGQGERLFLTLSTATKFGNFETTLTSPTAVVSQRLTGLTPGTLYHFRVVATGVGTTFGPDGTFTTFSQGAPGSAGRNYELVSPVEKIGEPFPPEPGGNLGGSCGIECAPGVNAIQMPMQATADGNTLSYEGQPFSPGLAPSANQYLAKRSVSGWSSASVTPPTAGSAIQTEENGFKAFSADLSRGVLFQTTPALAPEVPSEGGKSFKDLYYWEASNPNLRPLVTMAQTLHRSQGEFELSFSGGNSGAGGVPAFEHLIFEANDALTLAVPNIAPEAPEVEAGQCSGFPEGNCDLYEWVAGQLRLINVLPGNKTAATHAVIGSGRRLTNSLASSGGQQAPDVDHAISADGSRIFWSDESGQVYVRVDGKETLKIEDPGQFLTASVDGSKVLLTDGCLYSLASESCEFTLGGSASAFQGTLGASEDLSRIYFIDSEALATGAEPASCESTETAPQLPEEREGKDPAGVSCNLYAFDDGEVSFIGLLRRRDNEFGDFGAWKASPAYRVAQVSPDGRYLTFMSLAHLNDYDNVYAGSNDFAHAECKSSGFGRCPQVYEYDLASKSLQCASCNPSGQRPIGKSNLSLIRPFPGVPFTQPENLPSEGEGRLFFESQDKLVGADTNGATQDVYEWTPNGVGGCERAQGCLALISSGHSPNDSYFVTSTPDAASAFLITREQLLAEDKDVLLDVYDARVGGGFDTGTLSPCAGEGCKAPIGPPPPPPPPGSAGFSGPGNQKPNCKRGSVRKHGKCVKRRHHKKKSNKSKKTRAANGNRGGSK